MKNTESLVQYIRAHGHQASINAAGKIEAVEVFTRMNDGQVETFEELVTIEPNAATVRNWLGY